MMRFFTPITPSLRHLVLINRTLLWPGKPLKHLTEIDKKKTGRGGAGRFIIYHHPGGGFKNFYRKIDYKRTYFGIPARIIRLEYDPKRSSFIALIYYLNGIYTYIIAPFQITSNTQIKSSIYDYFNSSNIGATGPIYNIAIGTLIHNIELRPFFGGVLIRAAGCFAQLLKKGPTTNNIVQNKEKRYNYVDHSTISLSSSQISEKYKKPIENKIIQQKEKKNKISFYPSELQRKFKNLQWNNTKTNIINNRPIKQNLGQQLNIGIAIVRLRSGEIRVIHASCLATVGSVSNFEHRYINYGKAGRCRWLNKRPIVRGVAKNPVDHPHGGATSGGRIPVTPWSKYGKGKPTRKITRNWLTTI